MTEEQTTALAETETESQVTALTFTPELEASIVAMEQTADQCSFHKLKTMSPIRKTMVLGMGINHLRKLFSGPILEYFMDLANTDLGFRTDRPPGAKDAKGNSLKPYTREQVRDVVIEAAIRGVNPTGNEFNIISGRCYITKQFYIRFLNDYDGFTDLRTEFGSPRMRGDLAYIPCRAEWKLNSIPDSIELFEEGTEIVVRANKGMSYDALLGKAESKLLKRVFCRVTRSKQSEVDSYFVDNDDEVLDAPRAITQEPVVELNWELIEVEICVDAYESDIARGDGLPNEVRTVGASWYKQAKSQEDKDRIQAMVERGMAEVKKHRGEASNKESK